MSLAFCYNQKLAHVSFYICPGSCPLGLLGSTLFVPCVQIGDVKVKKGQVVSKGPTYPASPPIDLKPKPAGPDRAQKGVGKQGDTRAPLDQQQGEARGAGVAWRRD